MARTGGLVLAIFGPTASGKSAVAEAIAERIPAEIVSATPCRRTAACRSSRTSPCGPTRLVGIWPLDHGLGGRVRGPGARGDRRDPHERAHTDRRRRHRPVPARGARRARRPPAPQPGRGSGGSSTTSGADAAHEALAAADPTRPQPSTRTTAAGSCGRSSSRKRDPPLRPERSLWTEEMRHPTLVAGLDVPAETLAGGSRSGARAMVSAEPRTRRSAPLQARSRPRRKVIGLEEFATLRPRRPSRPSSAGRGSTPPTSASGSAAFPALLAFGPIVLRTRSPMRFSKWHGLGNDYLLVERADVGFPLEAPLVRRLCDYHLGIDGILEVLSAEGPRAEIVIWNPDGSTAELVRQRHADRRTLAGAPQRRARGRRRRRAARGRGACVTASRWRRRWGRSRSGRPSSWP